ncbi:hypothetical protein BaRGS_00030238 [Batillaria attramentaria]|uniref:Uncharacterized protein n=1 Tax=Batillaria attramentaria TaxID=370345 RepID=A0ABD0JUW5_9CAEN
MSIIPPGQAAQVPTPLCLSSPQDKQHKSLHHYVYHPPRTSSTRRKKKREVHVHTSQGSTYIHYLPSIVTGPAVLDNKPSSAEESSPAAAATLPSVSPANAHEPRTIQQIVGTQPHHKTARPSSTCGPPHSTSIIDVNRLMTSLKPLECLRDV